MPQDYHHGVRVIEISGGGRPIRTVSTAVIGAVCISSDADESAFPFDTPVLLTNIKGALGKAGTKGTLYSTLKAISNQTNAFTIVVRVREGKDAQETQSRVMGMPTGDGKFTGLYALATAQSALGIKPRILIAPQLDSQPVAEALAQVCKELRAFAYVSAFECKTTNDATAYRKHFSDRELMVIWPDFIGWDDHANAASVVPASAVAAGVRAKIDNDIGWHKTLSNVPVSGVTGMTIDVMWDLQSDVSDAAYLNEAGVTTIANYNGFRFWGSRTCDADSKFFFENYTRTAQVIADTIAEAQMGVVDGTLTPSLARDIIENINAWLRRQTANGYLIGGSSWYDPEPNTADSLSSGQMLLDYDYTPVPPLENLKLRQRITDRYLADFASRVTA